MSDPFPYPEPGQWPPNYVAVFAWRQRRLQAMIADPILAAGAIEYYRHHWTDFIEHWMTTYDPRNAGDASKLTTMPFVLFQRQRDLVLFIQMLLATPAAGLIEKCRDMGATWLCAAVSVCIWRFLPGGAVGWGSRKQELVDELGIPDSIMEKIRILIRRMPPLFWPQGFDPDTHMPFMRILNPQSGASITGEVGDNIGRGGRKLIYFKDESAHYERPDKIEAALSENTRVPVDISSVNGTGNLFHKKRDAGIDWQPGMFPVKFKTNVFVMDWRDHPAKTEEWYFAKRKQAEDEGTLALFAQEVDRDYASSVTGIVIRPEWVNAAIDADKKLGFDDEGPTIAGLDVGGDTKDADKHALVIRKGPVCKFAEQWGAMDGGATARKAVLICKQFLPLDLDYDSIGVGATIKAETNRLRGLGELPDALRIVPWAASAKVLYPEQNLIPGDLQSPLNKDFFGNLKAQAWFQVARRFQRTFRAVTEGIKYDPGELISIPSDLPQRKQLQKELSQATMDTSRQTGKLLIDKAPNDTKSPNMADAFVQAYWPVNTFVAWSERGLD